MLSDVLYRLRSLFRRQRAEAELEDELRFHFQQQVEKHRQAGLDENEARRRARLAFGGADQIKEECREARGVLLLENTLQDLVYALRTLRNKPVFSAVAVLTLALGVGANTAMFSIVNAVLLRPLPYADSARLVRVIFSQPGIGMRDVPFSVPELEDLRTRAGIFEYASAMGRGSANLTGGKQPERLEMVVATPDYFALLGVTPQIGRLYGPRDFVPGFAPVTVISDAVWRRSYGGDPNAIGKTVWLDNDPYTIIGVLPPGFRHPDRGDSRQTVEIWTTAGFSGDPVPKPARGTRFIPTAIARLKPGITLRQAQVRLAAMAVEIRRDFPGDYPAQAKWTIEIQPLQEAIVGNVRPMLLVLFGAVVLIVLIVSLNIANLLLARASGRQHELAVRFALGAGSGRIVRQMLTESVLLSLIGGGVGAVTAVASLKLITGVLPAAIPRLNEISMDWVVLAFAFLTSLLTGVLFGLAPAIQAVKSSLVQGIREGSRGAGSGVKAGRLRDALIVSELAIAVVLMIGAGLLLRTFEDLVHQNPGFNPAQVVAADVTLPEPNDPKLDPYLDMTRQNAFRREVLRRVNAIPGVQLAAITSDLPATPQADTNALAIEDRPADSSQNLHADLIRISPDYFKVMQVPLVRGRFFTEGDSEGKQLVAIVDESTARRYWPGRDPIGRRIRWGQDRKRPWLTIAGIVKDMKNDGLDIDGVPHVYVSNYQSNGDSVYNAVNRTFSVVLRTSLPAAQLEPRIRHEIQSIDPGLPVAKVASMNEVIGHSLASRRFSAVLVGGFALVALLLASTGVYGLLAYMVGQRSPEIAIRIALGARGAEILKMILARGVVLAGAGTVAGLALAAAAASLMANLLYGVRPHDPLVFLTVPVVLFAVAVLASYVPAHRATQVDPITALRDA